MTGCVMLGGLRRTPAAENDEAMMRRLLRLTGLMLTLALLFACSSGERHILHREIAENEAGEGCGERSEGRAEP